MKAEKFLQILQFEQVSKGIPAILGIKENTSHMPAILGNTQKMLEKQEQTVEEIKALRVDLKSYMDGRFAKIEHEIAEIKAKVGIE